MSAQRTFNYRKKQQGFTLIELLVVVSVLAAMAGIAAIAMDGYEQNAQEQLVKTEMKRIASAIYRFKEDTGYFPEEGIFPGSSEDPVDQVNFDWLFTSPKASGNEILPWNVNSGRGWHGPYIELSSQEQIVFDSAACDQSGTNFNSAYASAIVAGNVFTSLTDTFERQTLGADSCVATKYDGEWQRREFTGQVYRYDTDYENNNIAQCQIDSVLNNGCIVLASAGADSDYGTPDDVVSVLRAKK